MRDWLASWFRLRRGEYFADFFITSPLTALALFISVQHGLSPLWFIEFVAGLVVWTFYEYATHRWLLHRTWLFRDIHALHHANQKDYIALHPAATLSLYVIMWLVFGFSGAPAMVGFSIGYVAYSLLHTAFHYSRIGRCHPLFALKRHHALHHMIDHKNFGVTTSLWDRVFDTKLG